MVLGLAQCLAGALTMEAGAEAAGAAGVAGVAVGHPTGGHLIPLGVAATIQRRSFATGAARRHTAARVGSCTATGGRGVAAVATFRPAGYMIT